jgi:hypothetical protein
MRSHYAIVWAVAVGIGPGVLIYPRMAADGYLARAVIGWSLTAAILGPLTYWWIIRRGRPPLM